MARTITKKHPCLRRWLRRVLIVLIIGVLITVASSWTLQWRGFKASAISVRWSWDASVLYFSPRWSYAGNGVFQAHYLDFDADWSTSVGIDIHHVPDLPWYVVNEKYVGDEKSDSYIRRNEWDYSRPAARTLEPPDHPVVSSIHIYGSHSQHAFTLFNQIEPERALDLESLDQDWSSAERCVDESPGWCAASSFLWSRDKSLHALHRPVERWSAQRAGWPMHAMMTEQYAIGPRPPIERVQDMPVMSLRHGLRGGLILHHMPQHPMLHPLGHFSLPIVPVWPGFLVNTTFYAGSIAILWLCVAGSRHALGTRKRRRAQGLCETCGYAWTDLNICPECGARRTPEV